MSRVGIPDVQMATLFHLHNPTKLFNVVIGRLFICYGFIVGHKSLIRKVPRCVQYYFCKHMLKLKVFGVQSDNNSLPSYFPNEIR